MLTCAPFLKLGGAVRHVQKLVNRNQMYVYESNAVDAMQAVPWVRYIS